MLFGIIKRQKGRGILRGRSGVIWTKDRASISAAGNTQKSISGLQ